MPEKKKKKGEGRCRQSVIDRPLVGRTSPFVIIRNETHRGLQEALTAPLSWPVGSRPGSGEYGVGVGGAGGRRPGRRLFLTNQWLLAVLGFMLVSPIF